MGKTFQTMIYPNFNDMILAEHWSGSAVFALAQMETTGPGTAYKSQLVLAHPVFAVHHIRDGGSNGGQSLRNWNWLSNDFIIGAGLFRFHPLEEQTPLVPERHQQYDDVPAKAPGCGWQVKGCEVIDISYGL